MPATNNFKLRLTGEVRSVEHIQGVSKTTGEQYSFWKTNVLTDDDVIAVTYQRDMAGFAKGLPKRGDKVDYLVEVRLNASGRNINITAQGDFLVEEDQALDELLRA